MALRQQIARPAMQSGLASLLLWLASVPFVEAGEQTNKQSASALYRVKVIRNIAYRKGPGTVPRKHNLDMYLPLGKKDAPVLFYVHGGAWSIGDKNQFGVAGRLGHSLAKRGIAFVSVNYRLSPNVKHPAHIRDVARAFAWTCQNIEKYGGSAKEIFVSGHSAGAHLAALLSTNERFLKERGLTLTAIRGTIPISGVYKIPAKGMFRGVFGDNSAVLKDASPIHHVNPHVPPFLIMYAEKDFSHCDRPCARAFFKSLTNNDAKAQIVEIKDRNHVTIWFKAPKETDPVNRAIFNFIISHTTMSRLTSRPASAIDLLHEFIAVTISHEDINQR